MKLDKDVKLPCTAAPTPLLANSQRVATTKVVPEVESPGIRKPPLVHPLNATSNKSTFAFNIRIPLPRYFRYIVQER